MDRGDDRLGQMLKYLKRAAQDPGGLVQAAEAIGQYYKRKKNPRLAIEW